MFVYCTQALHLSEAEAYRRITVARAARQYEGLLDMLRDGRLHLTGMALVVRHLTPENCRSVLARATHRSKRDIQKLVAELSPQPDIPAVIRKLPQKRLVAAAIRGHHPGSGTGSELFPETVDLGPDGAGRIEQIDNLGGHERAQSTDLNEGTRGPLVPETAGGYVSGSGLSHRREGQAGPGAGPELFPETVGPSLARSRALTPPAVIEPLSPARYKVQFTASQELRDMLERLTTLMRSEVPDGDLAAVIERAVSEKLQRLEARRFGKTKAPRKTLADTATNPGSRYVPAALRRAVRERDEGRCRFVDGQGRRCTERHRLEFHHDFPFAKGGDLSLVNIKLLCEQHNRYLAEVDYEKKRCRPR